MHFKSLFKWDFNNAVLQEMTQMGGSFLMVLTIVFSVLCGKM